MNRKCLYFLGGFFFLLEDKTLERSEELCLNVGDHEFSQMQGDLDQQRLLGDRPSNDPVAEILIKELQQKERWVVWIFFYLECAIMFR